MKKVKVLFLCGGKDFHAMDKYKLIVDAMSTSEVVLVTDTIEGEGQFSLIKDSYKVERLFILDKFTPNYQSKLTHRWRNFLKILLLPIQVLKLRKIYKRYQPQRVHSVPIYYMFLCYLAKIPFIPCVIALTISSHTNKADISGCRS